MFDFIDMFGNYEERQIARFEQKNLIVDTCAVTDNIDYSFETAVSHTKYNSGKWIIVEQYKHKPEAEKGHDKWVQIMTAEILPEVLVDVATNNTSNMLYSLVDESERIKNKE